MLVDVMYTLQTIWSQTETNIFEIRASLSTVIQTSWKIHASPTVKDASCKAREVLGFVIKPKGSFLFNLLLLLPSRNVLWVMNVDSHDSHFRMGSATIEAPKTAETP